MFPGVSYDPERSFQLQAYNTVGGYAFQPVWGDGHSTGLYSYELLRRLESSDEDIITA